MLFHLHDVKSGLGIDYSIYIIWAGDKTVFFSVHKLILYSPNYRGLKSYPLPNMKSSDSVCFLSLIEKLFSQCLIASTLGLI